MKFLKPTIYILSIALLYIGIGFFNHALAAPATNTWYAGVNSTNGGNNSGWVWSTDVTDPPRETMRGTIKMRGTVRMR